MKLRFSCRDVALCGALIASMHSPAYPDTGTELKQAYIDAFAMHGSSMGPMEVFSMLFMRFDRNGNGIEATEIDMDEKLWLAETRARIAADMLRKDLDGDLVVSKAEIEQVIANQLSGRYNGTSLNDRQKKRQEKDTARLVNEAMRADKDGNGLVEKQELYLVPQRREDQFSQRQQEIKFVRSLLAADPTADGKLTQAEGATLLAQHLGGIEAEVAQLAMNPMKRELERRVAACPKIEVPADTDFVVLGVYDSEILSNVTVAGQDAETHGAALLIEDGQKPLTVLVSSFTPMVLDVRGKTSRIAKLIMIGQANRETDGKVAAGVVGLPRDKVQFAEFGECLSYFYEADSVDGLMAKSVLTRLTGRAPDAFFGRYGIDVVAIPSGAGTAQNEDDGAAFARIQRAGVAYYSVGDGGSLVQIAQANGDNNSNAQTDQIFRFNRKGLMGFKPEDVVSDTKVESYITLPKAAGLAQQVKMGKLARIDGGWKVLGPMRFPAGLHGAHRVTFIVPRGVPVPEGDPGHSCVFLEEKAETLDGKKKCR